MRTPVVQNKSIYRGDYNTLTFLVPGDHTARKIVFVIKADNSITGVRLVEKKNVLAGGSAAQIIASAVRGSTLITVYLLPLNTASLTNDIYYLDITSEHASTTTDHYTVVYGDANMILDIQTPTDGAVATNVDASLVRSVFPGNTVKAVIAEFSDEAADNVYSILIYTGAAMGTSFVNRSYINYQWMAQAGVEWDFNEADLTGMNLANADFSNADFTNCDCSSVTWTGAIVDGADFTGATISLSLNDFKNAVGHFNPVTTIWTDGNPIGDI